MAKLIYRNFELDRAKVDNDKRTVPILFSTETAVDRGSYDEILDHAHVDLSRMADAPLLLNHDPDKQIGVVEAAQISGKEGRAIVRFGKSALAEEIFQDVKDGIRKQASVGYDRTKAVERTKLAGGRDAIRFAWQPFELTITPVGADPNTGVGRSQPITDDPLNDSMKRNLLFAPDPADGGDKTALRAEVLKDYRALELKRMEEIGAAVDLLVKDFPEAKDKFRDLSDKAIRAGTSTADFNIELLHALPGLRRAEINRTAELGLTEKESKRYSLLRGIRGMMEHGKVDGFELECHQEMAKRCKDIPYGGFLVPADIMVDPGSAARGRYLATGYRDLNVTQATQGGNLVPTQLVTPIIELLRNRMVTRRLGVQMLSGLSGNIAIPRQTGAATAYTLAEQAVLVKSTQAIGQIAMSPHRVGTTTPYSKQLVLQSSIDVENFLRDDQMKVLAIKIDALTLQGAGGADPLGILNTTGIGSVTFGAAATWAKVLAFETALSLANADDGNIAFATTPDVRAKWKAATKIAASQFSNFLWEAGGFGDGTNDGSVNGYRAAVTNQILNSLVFFGNWADDIVGMWGGFDVVIDPFTGATAGTVNVTVNTFIDNAVRHAASFAVSSDSGAQ